MEDISSKGVNQGEVSTPSASPAEQKTSHDSNEKPGQGGTRPEGGDDKRTVSAERLNELIEKAREVDALKTKLEQLETGDRSRLEAARAALDGRDSFKKYDESTTQLSKKYNVDPDFIEELQSSFAVRAKRELEGTLRPLQTQSALAQWEREYSELTETIPDARSLTATEKQELQKLSVQPAYNKVPLTELYKIYSYGKAPRPMSAESSRGGARQFSDDGEVDPRMAEVNRELDQLRKSKG